MEWLSPDDEHDADLMARRWLSNPVTAQLVRAETMNVLKTHAQSDPDNAADYEAVFDLIKQEALDAERSADRALGIRGGERVRFWAHCYRAARDSLQWLSRMVRRVLSSLPRL